MSGAEDAAVGLPRLAATSRSTARARETNGATCDEPERHRHRQRPRPRPATCPARADRPDLHRPTAGVRDAERQRADSRRRRRAHGADDGVLPGQAAAGVGQDHAVRGQRPPGGRIRTDRVPVDVDGTRGTVSFERGSPRTLSSLHLSTWRFDDLVLYDLVRRALPGATVWVVMLTAGQALDLGLKIATPPDKPRYIFYPDHLVALPPPPASASSSASPSSSSPSGPGWASSSAACARAPCPCGTCPSPSGCTT